MQKIPAKEVATDREVFGASDLDQSLKEIKSKKFMDFVNVKDFGAVGDGVTDDTEAIQNAISEAYNQSGLFFPKGEYLIKETLVLDNFINIVGANIKETTLSFELNSMYDYAITTVKNKNIQGISISNLDIFNKNYDFTKTGIFLDGGDNYVNFSQFNLYNVKIKGFEIGFENTINTGDININKIFFVNNKLAIKNKSTLMRCDFIRIDGWSDNNRAIEHYQGRLFITNSTIQSLSGIDNFCGGIKLKETPKMLVLENCHLESLRFPVIHIDTTTPMRILNIDNCKLPGNFIRDANQKIEKINISNSTVIGESYIFIQISNGNINLKNIEPRNVVNTQLLIKYFDDDLVNNNSVNIKGYTEGYIFYSSENKYFNEIYVNSSGNISSRTIGDSSLNNLDNKTMVELTWGDLGY
jgi:hypothetical protein